jgi:hypothetical protein
LSVQAKAGGVGYNLETYDGIATEIPDTRPESGERFDGMRVFTTDTRSVWMWNAPSGKWRLRSKPVTSFTPTTTFTLGAATIATKYWVSDETVHYQGRLLWGAGMIWGMNGNEIDLPIPAYPNIPRMAGVASFYNPPAGDVYPAITDIAPGWDTFTTYAPAPADFAISNTNPFTWVAGAEMWWTFAYPQAP